MGPLPGGLSAPPLRRFQVTSARIKATGLWAGKSGLFSRKRCFCLIPQTLCQCVYLNLAQPGMDFSGEDQGKGVRQRPSGLGRILAFR